MVSFSFDDFPRTAYFVGGAILKDLGVRATYYAAVGLMGTTNERGEHFSPEDLRGLVQDGHELANHTFSHISSRSVPHSVYSRDFKRGRQALAEIAGVADSGNFAYPFGDVTLETKRALGPETCSSRSIFPGFNGPEVDLNLLRANRLYGDFGEFRRSRELILENKRRRGWLIFYSHDVRPSPSRYGCTPELLESTASFALKQGCQVLSVIEALAELSCRHSA